MPDHAHGASTTSGSTSPTSPPPSSGTARRSATSASSWPRLDPLELDIVMLIHPARGDRLELLHRPGSRPGLRAADPARGRADRAASATWRSTSPASTPPSTGLVSRSGAVRDGAAPLAGAGRTDGLRRRPRGQPASSCSTGRRGTRELGRRRAAGGPAPPHRPAARRVRLAGHPDHRRLPPRAASGECGPAHQQRRCLRHGLVRPGRDRRGAGRDRSAERRRRAARTTADRGVGVRAAARAQRALRLDRDAARGARPRGLRHCGVHRGRAGHGGRPVPWRRHDSRVRGPGCRHVDRAGRWPR